MKFVKSFLSLMVIAFLAGCGPVDSLNPLYTEKDVVFDPALLGQWRPEKGEWNFIKTNDGGYQLVTSGTDDDGQYQSFIYQAHLLELQGHRFLDLAPSNISGPESNAWTLNLERHKSGVNASSRLSRVGFSAYLEMADGQSDANADTFHARLYLAHIFFKVEVDDDGKTLRLIDLDEEWMRKQIESGKLAVAHEMVGTGADHKTVVLTAATADLQKLVLDHWNDDEAFDGTTTVHRPGFEPEDEDRE